MKNKKNVVSKRIYIVVVVLTILPNVNKSLLTKKKKIIHLRNILLVFLTTYSNYIQK